MKQTRQYSTLSLENYVNEAAETCYYQGIMECPGGLYLPKALPQFR